MARWTDKDRADTVSSKSLIISLCLLLAMAASYYWFIKLAWINVINAITHSFQWKGKGDIHNEYFSPKKSKAVASGSVVHSVRLI